MVLALILLAASLVQASAYDCSQHRSCGACAAALDCGWCGLYSRTDRDVVDHDQYQGFGICSPAGAQCDVSNPVFANILRLFSGSWQSPSEDTLVTATATAMELDAVAACPSNDLEVDYNIFDPAKQTCGDCVNGGTWVEAAVFAHGANGAENFHRGGYCIDSYDDGTEVRFPLTPADAVLYTVVNYIQGEWDCSNEVPECDMIIHPSQCTAIHGKRPSCTWWMNSFFDENDPTTKPGLLYGGYCQVPYLDPIEGLFQRTGLKPLITADFGNGNKNPVMATVTLAAPGSSKLTFRYGLNTCEKCVAYKESEHKTSRWCHSTIRSSKTGETAEGGVCMPDRYQFDVECARLNQDLNDELSISTVGITDCKILTSAQV